MKRKLINIISKTIDYIVLIALIIILAYGIYSIVSSYAIINNAKLDKDIVHLKPEGNIESNRKTIQELKLIDPNIFAWIDLDGTKIDYPIVQGKDNHEYLRKDYKGNFSLSGAIYLDYRSKNNLTDPYSVVYGHHMDKGAMFGDLSKYKNKNFFTKNKTGKIYLEDKTYNVYVFSVIIVSSKDKNIFEFSDLSPMTNLARLEYIKEKSINYRDIGVNENSKVIALSTCNGSTNTDRIVVFAVLEEV